MATQEERLTKLEHSLADFQREMVAKTRETNENSTILLGLYYKQSIEIKDIHERLDTMDQRLVSVEQHLSSVEQRLVSVEQRLVSVEQSLVAVDQRLVSVETKLDEHTQLLHEILKRLPA